MLSMLSRNSMGDWLTARKLPRGVTSTLWLREGPPAQSELQSAVAAGATDGLRVGDGSIDVAAEYLTTGGASSRRPEQNLTAFVAVSLFGRDVDELWRSPRGTRWRKTSERFDDGAPTRVTTDGASDGGGKIVVVVVVVPAAAAAAAVVVVVVVWPDQCSQPAVRHTD